MPDIDNSNYNICVQVSDIVKKELSMRIGKEGLLANVLGDGHCNRNITSVWAVYVSLTVYIVICVIVVISI
jgi:hypothetical protein